MATSVYFQNYHVTGEQKLLEDLIIESIRQYGIDLYYCPKRLENFDEVYGEDAVSSYKGSYFVEMYIKNVDGWGGDGNFMAKFGIEIRDQVTLVVARRVFEDEVGSQEQLERPREGDLIFLPLNKKIFQIKFVNHESMFYQLGALQTYELVCELFEYSGERLNTGIEDIDEIEELRTTNMTAFSILTSNNELILTDDEFPLILSTFDLDKQTGDFGSENEEIQEESDTFLDFSESDPFSENGRY